MEQKTKHREWIKTAAIIFLSVLLILTFFSNTIMNHSLPEVATKAVQSGSINAQIRGTGNISADETYDVTISQSRKIQSVLARVGDEVRVGDTLFVLDAQESAELQAARDDLENMELAYQKSLINSSNSSAQENRDVQKLREAYNEALATYQLYSSADPSRLKSQLAAAEASLKTLTREAEDATKNLTDAQSNEDYLTAKADLDKLKSEMESLETQIKGYQDQIDELRNGSDPNKTYIEQKAAAERALQAAKMVMERDKLLHQNNYDTLEAYASLSDTEKDKISVRMAAYAEDTGFLTSTVSGLVADKTEEEIKKWEEENKLSAFPEETLLNDMATAYATLTADQEAIDAAQRTLKNLEDSIMGEQLSVEAQVGKLQDKIGEAQQQYAADATRIRMAQTSVNNMDARIEQLKAIQKAAQQRQEDQQDIVNRLSDAQNAAQALTSAKEALEDKLFAISLSDGSDLDLKKDKEAIEKKKEEIAKLEENSDAVEVTSKVNGIISAVNITAGNTASADVALATITIKDRGYTVRIPCTAEQARRVTVGDQAKLSNYYYYSGNVEATLEKIINDPTNPRDGRYLIFRLTGDGVEPGANITLSIGQKSMNYEALIPNSAVRSDTNGSYVLVLQEKSTPLSSRYFARRVDVTVLASDDTQTAVTGLSTGDFVITTVSRPIEAGAQVRLPEES